MNQILDYLYMCAMETGKTRHLTQDEFHDYKFAASSIEKLQEQLEQLLEGEALRLFKLYADNRDEEEHYDDLYTFRKALAMGLKLGYLAMSER